MTPLLVAFQRENPDVTLRFLTGERLFRLEYGEAHIAIRAGQVPEQPDNVVQPFYQFQMGLFAHKDYIAAFGMPSGVEEYGNHRFVGHDDAQMRAPFFKWMREVVPAHAISFRGLHADALRVAVLEAAGIGFVDLIEGRANPDLVEVHRHLPEWDSMLWLVTHVDLHRTPKVQALLSYLKKAVKTGL